MYDFVGVNVGAFCVVKSENEKHIIGANEVEIFEDYFVLKEGEKVVAIYRKKDVVALYKIQ